MEEVGSMSAWGPAFEAMAAKGWCFRDIHQLHSSAMQQTLTALDGNSGDMASSNLIEAEVLNMDLSDIGGRNLPYPSSLKKSSYLHGPKVLQVVSVRDVSRSSIDAAVKSFEHRNRVLRFFLTDGHSQVTAIEYVPIPSITDEIVPGTKVRLENRIPIHSGVLCLDSKSVKILGGRVERLYEEWQMNQKYAGFSRSSLRLPQSSESSGPPPFEKMQIGSHLEKDRYPNTSEMTLLKPAISKQVESTGGKIDVKSNISSLSARIEDKPSSSDPRPKEVNKAIPVQNQEAAQKLLQKMTHPNREERPVRGPKHRGKSKQDDPVVFTLEEWEKKKGAKPIVTAAYEDVSRDEELAWQLQKQLDMEDYHVKSGPESEAEQIRMNMFNFGRAEDGRSDGRREVRGRGRGRGRGRHQRRYG